MYLAYLDDGGKGDIRVFGGIVVRHSYFTIMEGMSGVIAAQMVPPERRASFEFHASDLFNGTGDFKDIDKEKRHRALIDLLRVPAMIQATYVYSAMDTAKLRRTPMRSVRWVDATFFMCACAIDELISRDAHAVMEKWLASNQGTLSPSPPGDDLTVFVLDEQERQEEDKKRIRTTFRALRGMVAQVAKPVADSPSMFTWHNRLSCPVDDVFFGSSADSVGLQVADACNWVMWRKLLDGVEDEFYRELMQARVVSAKTEPEWTELRPFFKAHDV